MTTTSESLAANAPLHSVLVVDDEEIVLIALRETLQREGYNVVTCPNAMEALALLRRLTFSAIISDQQMPMITGLEFLAQAKQIQPDATRILITAVLSLNTVIDAINKGEIYRFVVKPWLREDLLATVRNAVQRYELVCKNLVLQATTRAMNEKLSRSNQVLEERLAKLAQEHKDLERRGADSGTHLDEAVQLAVKLLQRFQPSVAQAAGRAVAVCRKISVHLDLSEDQRRVLEISAWLHDIGLVDLPRELVERWRKMPEGLTRAERAQIEKHPILGQELALFTGEFKEIGTLIRAHHERWDGAGYPDHLENEDIPWLARLLAIAVDLANRDLDPKSGLEQIESGSGSAFDPAAVRVVKAVLSPDQER